MFEGFTEAEIKNITSKELAENYQFVTKTNNKYKQGSFGSKSRDLLRAKRKNEIQRKMPSKDSNLPTTKEEEEYEEEEKKEVKVNENKESSTQQPKEANLVDVAYVLTSQSVVQVPPTTRPDVDAIKYANVDFQDSPSYQTLNEFEETQRKLEAFNLERKEQLRKALFDRAKKTHEEVKKLNQIEEELKQLDSTLSNDVCILRNQIESASHDFMEAQKRFNRAEKEYVEAKMELFTKKERKELLTSHLCSIIEQNELRKAKKISDLMEKLEVPTKPLPLDLPTKVDLTNKVANLQNSNNS
ncbi:golgin, RAB6 interacting isoform X2 [Rhodnius prolixus]|uniref:RAB6-interacting golgin n=1 Tax=Rhodnius prolixus TaxID=13249 RepID=T1HH52_RHOPR